MEKKNEQHSRRKFIEEQLDALKLEEKALNDIRMTLLQRKWQLQSENEKLKEQIELDKSTSDISKQN